MPPKITFLDVVLDDTVDVFLQRPPLATMGWADKGSGLGHHSWVCQLRRPVSLDGIPVHARAALLGLNCLARWEGTREADWSRSSQLVVSMRGRVVELKVVWTGLSLTVALSTWRGTCERLQQAMSQPQGALREVKGPTLSRLLLGVSLRMSQG